MGDEDLVSKFDVNNIAVEAQLFQAGYLTKAEEEETGFKNIYRLEYPNFQVHQSRND